MKPESCHYCGAPVVAKGRDYGEGGFYAESFPGMAHYECWMKRGIYQMAEVNLPLKLDLSGLDVDALVSQAILDSKIGDLIRKSIQERLSDYRFERIVGEAVEAEIKRAIVLLVREEGFNDRIKEMTRTRLSEDVVTRVVSAAIDNMLKGMD